MPENPIIETSDTVILERKNMQIPRPVAFNCRVFLFPNNNKGYCWIEYFTENICHGYCIRRPDGVAYAAVGSLQDVLSGFFEDKIISLGEVELYATAIREQV